MVVITGPFCSLGIILWRRHPYRWVQLPLFLPVLGLPSLSPTQLYLTQVSSKGCPGGKQEAEVHRGQGRCSRSCRSASRLLRKHRLIEGFFWDIRRGGGGV